MLIELVGSHTKVVIYLCHLCNPLQKVVIQGANWQTTKAILTKGVPNKFGSKQLDK